MISRFGQESIRLGTLLSSMEVAFSYSVSIFFQKIQTVGAPARTFKGEFKRLIQRELTPQWLNGV